MLSEGFATFFPMPAPELLEQYERISPGFTETLLDEVSAFRAAIIEGEEEERRLSEQRMKLEAESVKRGQQFALVFGLFSVSAGGVTGTFGSPTAGSFIGSAGVIGVVTAFVTHTFVKRGTK